MNKKKSPEKQMTNSMTSFHKNTINLLLSIPFPKKQILDNWHHYFKVNQKWEEI